MASIEKHVFKIWRGSRKSYEEFKRQGKVDEWTRYVVTDDDGYQREYYGTIQLAFPSGEIVGVKDVCRSFPTAVAMGDRYLIGDDVRGYSVVEVKEDGTGVILCPFTEDLSVKILSRNNKRYCLVNGKLDTFDHVDAGEF